MFDVLFDGGFAAQPFSDDFVDDGVSNCDEYH